jgi:hypothetical protein
METDAIRRRCPAWLHDLADFAQDPLASPQEGIYANFYKKAFRVLPRPQAEGDGTRHPFLG